MANKLFSFFKQGNDTYEVKDSQARTAVNGKLDKILGNDGEPIDYKIRTGYSSLTTSNTGFAMLDININSLISANSINSDCYCAARKSGSNYNTVLYFYDAYGNPITDASVTVRYFYLEQA